MAGTRHNLTMPAPETINEITIKQICDCLIHGAHISVAAMFAGITKQTIYEWVKIGGKERRRRLLGREYDNDKDIYVELVDAMEKAIATGEILDCKAISKAVAKDWRAAAWRLEHRRGKRWASKDYDDKPKSQSKIEVKVIAPRRKRKKKPQNAG